MPYRLRKRFITFYSDVTRFSIVGIVKYQDRVVLLFLLECHSVGGPVVITYTNNEMFHARTNHLFNSIVTVHRLTITVYEPTEVEWSLRRLNHCPADSKTQKRTVSSTSKCIIYTKIYFVVETTSYRKILVLFTN